MNASKLKTYSLAFSALFIAVAIVTFPKVSIGASLKGLDLWWNTVFPSLLPFFIVSELLIGFGVVTFIGVLFEPIMRPIFRVPGAGGFVFVMGLASGFPAGAKITARLYEEKQLTKEEAERLASFTNFSNPLFLFGVVAFGFFHQEALGIVFAGAHYLGNICVGLLMRYYKPYKISHREEKQSSGHIVINAFKKMHEERVRNRQPLGKMLGDAVQSSVSTLLIVGGFIILFSVFNQLLDRLNGTEMLGYIIKYLFVLVHISPDLSHAFVSGLFEITLGAQKVSQEAAPLIDQVVVTSFILGFCGFSIQAQVASILSKAKLSAKPFFIGRLFHGLFSAVFAFILFHFIDIKTGSSPQVNQVASVFDSIGLQHPYLILIPYLRAGSVVTLLTLIIFILIKALTVSKQNPR